MTLWDASNEAIRGIIKQWDIWRLSDAKAEVSEILGNNPHPWPGETIPESQSQRLMCVAMARGDVEQAERFYSEWDRVELYTWRSIQMASNYAPPSREDAKKAQQIKESRNRGR